MKIKTGFVLRTVAKENVVMAIGQASRLLNGIIKLNESGAMLWNVLKDGAEKSDLVAALQSTYEISAELAEKDVDAFLATLNSVGCIEA